MRLQITIEVDVTAETTIGDLEILRGDLREFLNDSDASLIVKKIRKIAFVPDNQRGLDRQAFARSEMPQEEG